MWDGPGHGPRGGLPFRGDRREMFGGRDRPMQDFRGRDGMHMGPMGQMGPRHLDPPPMDMRRMDGPPMRGRDIDPRDMRGREPNRDFFRPREEPDFSHRRHYDVPVRDNPMHPSGFPGPGRNPGDMGGRGMHHREPNNRFMEMRDRDSFHYDMPRFNNPNFDGRRGFPMDRMERNDGFRDMYDGPPMDIDDTEGYDMDGPPRERRMLDSERRGGQPFNPRGRFESDMDFRNRPGPPGEFRGRDRSPLRFGKSDVPPGDRERSDMPLDAVGPQRSEFKGPAEINREYPDSGSSPVMDYRCGEEMTLAEEWKNRQKDKNPFVGKGMGSVPEASFPAPYGRDVNVRGPPPFHERDKLPGSFPVKDINFPRGEHFPAVDLPPAGSKPPQDHLLPEMGPLPSHMDRESKQWPGERDPKFIPNKPNRDERPPYHHEKNQPPREIQEPEGCFQRLNDTPHNQGPSRNKQGEERDFQSSTVQARDQDYRDIDYRTGSGRPFEYQHEELQTPEKLLKDPKLVAPSKFADSGSKDQDYRNASVTDKVSNVVSITGIPKTATMEQILGAFAVRDGVPMQGMKIKNVVPGYSYDMAYVEFLNLEDAVHFMESNKVAHPRHSTKAVSPNRITRG